MPNDCDVVEIIFVFLSKPLLIHCSSTEKVRLEFYSDLGIEMQIDKIIIYI